MANKKKKPILNEKQKRAESFNRFVSVINAVMHKLGVRVRVQDLPASKFLYIYNTKTIAPKVLRKKTDCPKSILFQEIEYYIPMLMSNMKFVAEGLAEEISTKYMVTEMFDIQLFIKLIFKYHNELEPECKEKLEAFLNLQEVNFTKAFKRITSSILLSTYTFSDFKKVIHWIEMDRNTKSKFMASPYFNLIVHEFNVEQKVFLKDKFTRIGKKVYIPKIDQEPENIEIKLKDLGIGSSKVLDVYIQDHEYDRLFERLDALDISAVLMELIVSLQNVEYVVTDRNSKLIVYKYKGKKLGYFTFRILDDAILFTTFLFITNDSTPEGEKLRELTSLEKEDKKYLKIDRLSAFAQSDVRDNPMLVQLFEDAGCGHLFEEKYKPILRDVSFNNIADRMTKYLEREGGDMENKNNF